MMGHQTCTNINEDNNSQDAARAQRVVPLSSSKGAENKGCGGSTKNRGERRSSMIEEVKLVKNERAEHVLQ